jgi:3'-phosphoadenosine 5'-phosphosulfate sulfotransferase (PAPS reductase)/FAD synthetase
VLAGGAAVMDLSALDRHEHIALSLSGGKDSLACLYLLRPHMHRITAYHRDTGDLLPEVREIVAEARGMCPNFVHLQGDVMAWHREHGLPTDLLPHSAEHIGQAMGEGQRLVTRYTCCYGNLMAPLFDRIRADGNTLLIRGTKRVDMKRLPMASGDVVDGLELLLPLQEWSNTDVFEYLRREGAPICRIYEYVTNAPECARCPAWWGEKRAAYLRRFHPDLFADYRTRLQAVWREIDPALVNLAAELKDMHDA